jgi:hypothetical protein
MSGPAFYSGTMNIAKNEDWIVAFQYLTTAVSSEPVDLTGSVLEMHIRSTEHDHNAVVVLTSKNNFGIRISDAANGEFEVRIMHAQTTDDSVPSSLLLIAGAPYVADLVRHQSEEEGSEIERILDCVVTVVEGATR